MTETLMEGTKDDDGGLMGDVDEGLRSGLMERKLMKALGINGVLVDEDEHGSGGEAIGLMQISLFGPFFWLLLLLKSLSGISSIIEKKKKKKGER